MQAESHNVHSLGNDIHQRHKIAIGRALSPDKTPNNAVVDSHATPSRSAIVHDPEDHLDQLLERLQQTLVQVTRMGGSPDSSACRRLTRLTQAANSLCRSHSNSPEASLEYADGDVDNSFVNKSRLSTDSQIIQTRMDEMMDLIRDGSVRGTLVSRLDTFDKAVQVPEVSDVSANAVEAEGIKWQLAQNSRRLTDLQEALEQRDKLNVEVTQLNDKLQKFELEVFHLRQLEDLYRNTLKDKNNTIEKLQQQLASQNSILVSSGLQQQLASQNSTGFVVSDAFPTVQRSVSEDVNRGASTSDVDVRRRLEMELFPAGVSGQMLPKGVGLRRCINSSPSIGVRESPSETIQESHMTPRTKSQQNLTVVRTASPTGVLEVPVMTLGTPRSTRPASAQPASVRGRAISPTVAREVVSVTNPSCETTSLAQQGLPQQQQYLQQHGQQQYERAAELLRQQLQQSHHQQEHLQNHQHHQNQHQQQQYPTQILVQGQEQEQEEPHQQQHLQRQTQEQQYLQQLQQHLQFVQAQQRQCQLQMEQLLLQQQAIASQTQQEIGFNSPRHLQQHHHQIQLQQEQIQFAMQQLRQTEQHLLHQREQHAQMVQAAERGFVSETSEAALRGAWLKMQAQKTPEQLQHQHVQHQPHLQHHQRNLGEVVELGLKSSSRESSAGRANFVGHSSATRSTSPTSELISYADARQLRWRSPEFRKREDNKTKSPVSIRTQSPVRQFDPSEVLNFKMQPSVPVSEFKPATLETRSGSPEREELGSPSQPAVQTTSHKDCERRDGVNSPEGCGSDTPTEPNLEYNPQLLVEGAFPKSPRPLVDAMGSMPTQVLEPLESQRAMLEPLHTLRGSSLISEESKRLSMATGTSSGSVVVSYPGSAVLTSARTSRKSASSGRGHWAWGYDPVSGQDLPVGKGRRDSWSTPVSSGLLGSQQLSSQQLLHSGSVAAFGAPSSLWCPGSALLGSGPVIVKTGNLSTGNLSTGNLSQGDARSRSTSAGPPVQRCVSPVQRCVQPQVPPLALADSRERSASAPPRATEGSVVTPRRVLPQLPVHNITPFVSPRVQQPVPAQGFRSQSPGVFTPPAPCFAGPGPFTPRQMPAGPVTIQHPGTKISL